MSDTQSTIYETHVVSSWGLVKSKRFELPVSDPLSLKGVAVSSLVDALRDCGPLRLNSADEALVVVVRVQPRPAVRAFGFKLHEAI